MNIFVVHSGSDKSSVKETVKEIEEKEGRANLLILENGGITWKREAKRYIKQAQMVLYIVGKTSSLSKNIEWELLQALRKNKPILIYKLDEANKVNSCLYGVDRFSKRETFLAETASNEQEIIRRIQVYENQDYHLFNQDFEQLKREELLEQYKLFLGTSERLVERRQMVNSFYLSANAVLMTAAGAIVAVTNESNERILITLVVSVVGIVLSMSWLRILESYGTLNASKMGVITAIEKNMPLSLFDAEWQFMSDRFVGRKYISFTDSEKQAPKTFLILYLVAITIALLFAAEMLAEWLPSVL